MLLLLLACAEGKPRDASVGDTAPDDRTADDTTLTDDTGARADTDPPEAWVAPDVPCALSRPRAVAAEPVPLFGDLYGPDPMELYAVTLEFEGYARDFGCPTSTEDPVTGSVTWEGDCAFPELTWEGRWISTVTDMVIIQVGEGVQLVDDYSLGHTVAFDGTAAFEGDADGVETFTRDFTWSSNGVVLPQSAGNWTVTAYERDVPGRLSTYEGQLDVTDGDGPPGEYCVVREAFPYAGCDEEPWGGWVLVGDATLVVTYDPQVACDGCGAVTIDGVPAGEVCGSEYGAWVP